MKDLLILVVLFLTGSFIGASEQGHISLIQCGMLCLAALAVLFLINKADKPKKISTMALVESNRQHRRLQYIINAQKKTTNL